MSTLIKKPTKNFTKLPIEHVDRIISSFIEVNLKDNNFSIIRETLSRIGVKKKNNLFQSAHILHKKGKYYIVHFKQLLELDGIETNYDETDSYRLKKIIYLLCKWDLLEVVEPEIMCKDKEIYEKTFVSIVSNEDIKLGLVTLVKKYSL